MPTVSVLGADLYYEQYGEGPAVLFAHGIGGNAISWWQQVPRFRERYRCIVIDQPGFGRSGEPAGDDWSFVDCLAGLLDRLDVARVSLLAQSMGGRTCMGFALRHPERVSALVMSDTIGPLELPELGDWDAEVQRKRLELRARDIHPACGERMAREQPALHFLYRQLGTLSVRYTAESRPPGWLRIPSVPASALGAYTIPTLFIVGDEDVIAPPRVVERAANVVPGARLERFPETGHSVYFERPAAWNRVVDAFLAETVR